jgi:hypothetical protein
MQLYYPRFILNDSFTDRQGLFEKKLTTFYPWVSALMKGTANLGRKSQ